MRSSERSPRGCKARRCCPRHADPPVRSDLVFGQKNCRLVARLERVGCHVLNSQVIALGRRKQLDRGELWLYVVKPRNPLQFFWMVCRLCFGKGEHASDIDTFAVTNAEIAARASRLPVALDGEVAIMRTPLRYRSRPGALRVIVPAAG